MRLNLASFTFLLILCLTSLGYGLEENPETNPENQIVKPILISGFDDVLRQAENTGLITAALKIFEKDKTFAGMSSLYTVITNEEPDPKFFIVSGITSLLDSRIDHFLTESQYPTQTRFLRNWLTEWSLEDFKIAKIRDIIAKNPGRKFIVVFDNSDASLSLAKTLNEKYPEQIQEIYLRQVVEKTPPKSARPFFTAFDIALNEVKAGRLGALEAMFVAKSVITESRIENLFPSYAVCPKEYNPCSEVQADLAAACTRVKNHIQMLCKLRK